MWYCRDTITFCNLVQVVFTPIVLYLWIYLYIGFYSFCSSRAQQRHRHCIVLSTVHGSAKAAPLYCAEHCSWFSKNSSTALCWALFMVQQRQLHCWGERCSWLSKGIPTVLWGALFMGQQRQLYYTVLSAVQHCCEHLECNYVAWSGPWCNLISVPAMLLVMFWKLCREEALPIFFLFFFVFCFFTQNSIQMLNIIVNKC